MGLNYRYSIVIPFTLQQELYNQQNDFGYCNIYYASRRITGEQLEKEVKSILFERHNISPNDAAAITIFSSEQINKMFQTLTVALTWLAWIVGMGTLLAAIVGVTNIMLINVNERRREIGIRRALGAQKSDVKRQIVLESLMIVLLSGLGGLSLSSLIMLLINLAVGDKLLEAAIYIPVIPVYMAFTCLAIILFAGWIASLMPVAKALRIHIVTVLQEE